MATINEQVNKLALQIANNLALINGGREPGFLYSFYGDKTRYGCYCVKVDDDSFTFGDNDALTENPNKINPPLRPEEYANISIVYGEVYMTDYSTEAGLKTFNYLTDEGMPSYPSAGLTRNDLVYVFVGDSGSDEGIAFGEASATPVDPPIPAGSMAVARVVVGETGIVGTIVDLRVFATEGEGGTSFHNLLSNRQLDNQHPISAITDLQTTLDAKALAVDLTAHLNDLANPHVVTAVQLGAMQAYEQPTDPDPVEIGSIWIDTSV